MEVRVKCKVCSKCVRKDASVVMLPNTRRTLGHYLELFAFCFFLA